MKRLLITLTLAALWTLPAAAQKVYVNSSVASGDFVGNAYVFALKEHFRKSATYTVIDVSDDKSVEIDLVTLKSGEGVSAISIVTRLPWSDGGSFLVDHQILLVGQNRVEEMAGNLVADTDVSLSSLRAVWAKKASETTVAPASAQK
jgi:hypothetical protein